MIGIGTVNSSKLENSACYFKQLNDHNLAEFLKAEQGHLVNDDTVTVGKDWGWVPCCCRLYDAASGSVMARYEIHRILFYAHGTADSREAACFSFTYTQGETIESSIFQCYVFRCDIPEAVSLTADLLVYSAKLLECYCYFTFCTCCWRSVLNKMS